MLKEVILVDDNSTKRMKLKCYNLIILYIFLCFVAFTKKPLDNYLRKHFDNVKVVHLPDRMGLIRARLAGAKVATGEVLIFLDSHTEANVNWLPPLLGMLFILYIFSYYLDGEAIMKSLIKIFLFSYYLYAFLLSFLI